MPFSEQEILSAMASAKIAIEEHPERAGFIPCFRLDVRRCIFVLFNTPNPNQPTKGVLDFACMIQRQFQLPEGSEVGFVFEDASLQVLTLVHKGLACSSDN